MTDARADFEALTTERYQSVPDEMRAIPYGRTFDDVTPEEWRAATEFERDRFWREQQARGVACFCCLNCRFPTAYGQGTCEACR